MFLSSLFNSLFQFSGVLWFDHAWLKKQFCNCKDEKHCHHSYKDLKCKKEEDRENLAKLAHSIMSCKIPDESEDNDEQNMLRDFVLEVQQHRHTGTCIKKNTVCRFNFPKPVSEKTLLAIPIDERYPKLEETEKKKKLEKYKEILLKAKEVLSDKELDPNMR